MVRAGIAVPRVLPDNINPPSVAYQRLSSVHRAPLSAYSFTEWTHGSSRSNRHNGIPQNGDLVAEVGKCTGGRHEIYGQGRLVAKLLRQWRRLPLDSPVVSGKRYLKSGFALACYYLVRVFLARRNFMQSWLQFLVLGDAGCGFQASAAGAHTPIHAGF